MAKLVGLLVVLAFMAVAVAADRKLATAVGIRNDGSCDDNLGELAQACKEYVMFPEEPKVKPSDECCRVVKKADIPCLCSKVTKEIEHLVCMAKVVYVANVCGNPLTSGSKCGSYTVPSN